jgi:(2R)-3-sulfolactate dehydrogenase (NADP+)
MAWAKTNNHFGGPTGRRQDLIGLAFGNSPSARPAWGVSRALFGANPIAAVFPRRVEAPFSIDLLALDREGNSATDPKAGLKGCPWG